MGFVGKGRHKTKFWYKKFSKLKKLFRIYYNAWRHMRNGIRIIVMLKMIYWIYKRLLNDKYQWLHCVYSFYICVHFSHTVECAFTHAHMPRTCTHIYAHKHSLTLALPLCFLLSLSINLCLSISDYLLFFLIFPRFSLISIYAACIHVHHFRFHPNFIQTQSLWNLHQLLLF